MSFAKLNQLGSKRIPFLFVSDFEGECVEVFLLDELYKSDIEFSISEPSSKQTHTHSFSTTAVSFESYKTKFDKVIEKIKSGETYVLNLTQPTKIQTPLSLKEIYKNAEAHYKLRFANKFVCFSPESFITIGNNTINTYPMKGTIDASIVNAKEKILSDEKEMAEHVMIVDLLRNDLSIVAKDIRVKEFRSVKKISAGQKQLLQVSSHIAAELETNWHSNIGSILKALLPAGSISGAPKCSTVEIIKNVEGYERGYFSGVFGVYDGKSLDSGVMIRFVEQTQEGLVYKSGGGITLDSDAKMEYEELLQKVYLP